MGEFIWYGILKGKFLKGETSTSMVLIISGKKYPSSSFWSSEGRDIFSELVNTIEVFICGIYHAQYQYATYFGSKQSISGLMF